MVLDFWRLKLIGDKRWRPRRIIVFFVLASFLPERGFEQISCTGTLTKESSISEEVLHDNQLLNEFCTTRKI